MKTKCPFCKGRMVVHPELPKMICSKCKFERPDLQLQKEWQKMKQFESAFKRLGEN